MRPTIKPLTQLNRHKPEGGLIGDCFRTCIAMLLGCEQASEVPHFVEMVGSFSDDGKWSPGSDKDFGAALSEFLTPKCLTYVDIPFAFNSLEDCLAYHREMNPNLAYILSGMSANNCNHSVVCVGGEIVKDPSQDASGIIGPASDGYFWCGFLAYQPTLKAAQKDHE